MATFVFAMNLSLDGYVDHDRFAPDAELFRHWIDQVRRSAAAVYGRRIYEVMRYWDEDRAEWSADERAFAEVWRATPKRVVSRTLPSVGPNARLVGPDVADEMRRLKAETDGEVDVAGPELARFLGDLGLIDEYRLYYHPVVLGGGKPFFAGPRPPLRIVANDRVGAGALRVTCVPA